MVAKAYVEIADPYADSVVAEACEQLLKTSTRFPIPVAFREMLREVSKSRLSLPEPSGVTEPPASAEVAAKYRAKIQEMAANAPTL